MTVEFTQSDLDFAAWLGSRRRDRRWIRSPLIIPHEELERRAYDKETARLELAIRAQKVIDQMKETA